jgi:outer membrane protein TolC
LDRTSLIAKDRGIFGIANAHEMTRADTLIHAMPLISRLLTRLWFCALPILGGWCLSASAQPQMPSVAGTMPEDVLPGLKSLLETALKQSPTMIAQNITLAQAQAGRYFADAELWPQLGAGAGYTANFARSTSSAGAGPLSKNSGFGYSANLSQPIFQWGAFKWTSDIGKLAQKIAERLYADALRGVASAIRGQYLALVVKKVSLRNERYELKLYENFVANQEAKLKEGSISGGDILGPRLSLKEQHLAFDRAVGDFDHAKKLMMLLAGVKELSDESIPEELPRPTYSAAAVDSCYAAFQHQGAESTLQGQVYVMNIKQNDLSYRIAKTNLYPKFGFGANYDLGNSKTTLGDSVDQSFTITYSYGINGGWTIFDGFRTRGQKLSALSSKRTSERQLQTYVDSTLESANFSRKQLELSARALEIAEDHRALQQAAVEKVTVEFKEGTMTQSLLDSTQTVFNLADWGAINARVTYLSQWADFISLIGFDPILEAVPTRYLNSTSAHGK